MHDLHRGAVDRDAVEVVRHAGARVDPLEDLQAPRQFRVAAVELLVEVVADPPDRLGERDSRRDRVGREGQRHPLAPAGDPRTERTQRDRARDAETAVPDLQRVDRVLAGTEVTPPVGRDVVEPAAHQPERHRPHGDVDDGAGRPTPGTVAPITKPDGHDDADDDAQRVGPDRQRPQMPDTLRRARNVGQHGPGGNAHQPTVSGRCEPPVNAPTRRGPRSWGTVATCSGSRRHCAPIPGTPRPGVRSRRPKPDQRSGRRPARTAHRRRPRSDASTRGRNSVACWLALSRAGRVLAAAEQFRQFADHTGRPPPNPGGYGPFPPYACQAPNGGFAGNLWTTPKPVDRLLDSSNQHKR